MYKLIAFDAYGTLFDVYSMGQLAEELFPGHGQAFALMWRDRQIEYTRLVTDVYVAQQAADNGDKCLKHHFIYDSGNVVDDNWVDSTWVSW